LSPRDDSAGPAAAAIRRRLLRWYDTARRDLPWRRTRDPYLIWIAEVMLVQTQVDTAIPYYNRFIARFPDVRSLAAASLDAVLKSWEGLGYYARARNLHAAAAIVVDRHGGRLPDDAAELQALPGIGPYMAAAIQSIAFGYPALALDGNVRRVLSRLYDLPDPKPAALRQHGDAMVQERPGDVNQALMDLGSAICTPRSPRCADCPLETLCLARQRGTVAERPGRRPAKRRPHYDIAVGVVWRGDEILIAKRKPEGLLGGLWEFPGGKPEPGESLEAAVVREVVPVSPRHAQAAGLSGIRVGEARRAGPLRVSGRQSPGADPAARQPGLGAAALCASVIS
jgi:A/G-specific adenine glycosylase